MMNEEDLGSDVSDEDYIPEGPDAALPSEEDSDGDPEDDANPEDGTGKRKSRGKTKKKSKKLKEEIPPEEEKEEEKVLTEEEQKKKADSLWADFLKDTNTTPKPKPVAKETETEKTQTKSQVKPVLKKEEEKTVSVTKIFEFAGEEVKVTKEVPVSEARVSTLSGTRGRGRGRGRGGLSSALSLLGKKEKISTLEKSKLDWDRFKKDENIAEELHSHNKGKDGYLERQDFLQRADLRQFELEKEFRTKQRSSRL